MATTAAAIHAFVRSLDLPDSGPSFEHSVGVTFERLQADKDVIGGRVSAFIADFVQNVEL